MEANSRIYELRAQQKQIRELETEVKNLAHKINQSINCLQVEELQLKAIRARNIIKSNRSYQMYQENMDSIKHESTESPNELSKFKASLDNSEEFLSEIDSSCDEYKLFDDPNSINQQPLNLNF